MVADEVDNGRVAFANKVMALSEEIDCDIASVPSVTPVLFVAD